MAENFDLIFGQNASQQYAWSDNDYQNGWGTIGNIPPTAAQFDALQRRSDTKMKELNDELTPLVNANTTDNRQPSTAYSEGTIKYTPLLPTGWFLTCTVAGITSASEIVLPTPIAENDTVTDGTVTWEIHKIGTGSGGDGAAVGDIKAIAHNGTIQDGWLECDGRAVSRTMFPDLFDKIGTAYGAGDGLTTFNLPNYSDGKFPEGSTVAGVVKQAGLPNITGSAKSANGLAMLLNGSTETNIPGANDGAITTTLRDSVDLYGTTGATSRYTMSFDASLSNPIYGNSDTVQPYSLTVRYVIKAYDGVTPTPAEADISQMLTELTGKATRALDNLTQDGEDHFLDQDFTIIYPNGGSEASPASLTAGARYVESNPFPGYYVYAIFEIYYNNTWSAINNGSGFTTPQAVPVSYGVNIGAFGNDKIALQVGSTGYSNFRGGSIFNLDLFGISGEIPTSNTPCRVKVWKIGKIPTE